MKRFLKWTAVTLASIVALALIAIYAGSEFKLRQKFDIPAAPIAIATDSTALARGQHIFQTRGCEGCHGDGMAGKVFFDQPMLARLVAPNVPRAIKSYSDPELARLLRHGVRPNGSGVAVMPSSMFYHLDDGDLAALIAYLRTLPDRGNDSLPSTSMRILARVGIVTGQYKLEPVDIKHDAPRPENGPHAAARGLYLAKTTCTECHGQQFEGGDGTPALMVVQAYTREQFTRLVREGVPRDGRKLELMAEVAKSRLVHLTDDEVSSLYTYLSHPANP